VTITPPASGADLARQALAAARASARQSPVSDRKQRTRTTRAARSSGRDPVGIDGILKRLSEDQDWNTGLDGGSILDRWQTLCPTALAHLIRPEGYDPDRGLLTLRPAHHAAATQARLVQQQLVAHLNAQIGRPAVRAIRVLAPGSGTEPAAMPPRHAEPPAPVKTRETASAGYRQAFAAVQEHKPNRQPTDPYLLEAIARQEAAARANRQDDSEHRDAAWELDRLAAAKAAEKEASRQAAIARARDEKAGRNPRRLSGAA
jgi:hypothetical protein